MRREMIGLGLVLLAMKHEGSWPVQNRLAQREWCEAGCWEFGKVYALKLKLDKAGVRRRQGCQESVGRAESLAGGRDRAWELSDGCRYGLVSGDAAEMQNRK